MRANLAANCVPAAMLAGDLPEYDNFLVERRRLMALKISRWFEALS